MNVEVIKVPDTVLSFVSEEVTEITEDTVNLVAQMGLVMYQNGGVGLAANQIGIVQRIFVYHLNDGVLRAVINPKIVSFSGTQYGEEGCLSIPDKSWEIKRHDTVNLIGLDHNGNVEEKEASGIEAVIFQHEIDHLDGITLQERRKNYIP